jgi:hypothetical protein
VYEFVFVSDVHINTLVKICDLILLIPASSPKLIIETGTSSLLSLPPESSQVHRILHNTTQSELKQQHHSMLLFLYLYWKWAVVSVNQLALIEI